MSEAKQWKYLAPNPKSAYRQLFIDGTRIRARVVFGLYASETEPMSIAEIAEAFDVPLEAVEEAIAYCETTPPEIADDFTREEQVMEITGMNDPNYKTGGKYKVISPQERARLGL